MDYAGPQEVTKTGEDLLVSKYLTHAATTVVVWDHLITLSDEVKYVWKKEKSWPFWLFIVVCISSVVGLQWLLNSSQNRYSILLCETWNTIALSWPGGTQEVCDRTVKLEGYYFVFIISLGHVFLTVRVYALTGASKYVLLVFGILVTSSAATGLWLISIPSTRAIQVPEVPLDPFQACVFSTSETAEWVYRSQVALADLVAFVCIVVFVLKLKADNGQSRMTRLMRTILQDGVLYFFVMAVLHIAMMSFTAFAKPPVSSLPPVTIKFLVPVMISRLVISVRKAVGGSLVQVWDRNHFTAVESDVHEMVDSGDSPPTPTSSLPLSHRDSKQPSRYCTET